MNRISIAGAGFCALMALFATGTFAANPQVDGPIRQPTPTVPPPFSAASNKPEPPAIPPEEIIKRFAAREDEMLNANLGYGFDKSVRLEEIGPDNKPVGQVEIVTQQIVGPDGKHYEKILHRSESTLRHLQMERGDSDVIESAPLFPLTTSQLPKYEITYQGKQSLDELNVYIFAVKPRALDRVHSYFSGVVWVDQQDLVIVKTIGKWINENGDVTSPELPFTIFETYRQQVGKNEWFPEYSRSDDFFQEGDKRLPIRIVIEWSHYTPATGAPPGASPPTSKP